MKKLYMNDNSVWTWPLTQKFAYYVLLHILCAVPYTQSCDVHSVLWWIHLVLQYTINIIWHTLCAVELHSVLWHSHTVDTIARSVYHSTEFMPQHWLFIQQATALSILHSTGCMQQHQVYAMELSVQHS